MRAKGIQTPGLWKVVLALFGALVLASCSNSSPPAQASGKPVVLSGVIASDGTLAGQVLELSGAAITENGDPTDTGLKPGMVVTATGVQNGNTVRVQSADIRIELKGGIEDLDLAKGTLKVLGTPVEVDALTRMEDENGTTLALADFAVGDYVKVSGVRKEDGSVLATYLGKKQVAEDQVEALGFACHLDAAAQTFALWSGANCEDSGFDTGIVVDFASATVEGTLSEGARVEVKGTLEGDRLAATKVEFKGQVHSGTYAEVELYGPVTNLDEAAMTFELLDYTVDYAAARVQGTLAEEAYVEVKGTPDPDDPTLIHALRVHVKYPGNPKKPVPIREVKGTIESIDYASLTLTVAGVNLYADENTVIKQDDPDRPIAFSDLAPGDQVEVKYDPNLQNDAGAFYAVKIEKMKP